MDDVTLRSTKELDTVDAQVRYINAEWRDKAESPRIGSKESRRANTSFQPITVHNARPRFDAGEINHDQNGFTLSQNRATVENFRDEDEVQEKYHPQMIDLIKRETGAAHAFVRGHLIRTETPIDFNDGYARFVHCDYNMARLHEMTYELLEQHGVTPQKNWKYAWFNTWQPFDNKAVSEDLPPRRSIETRLMAVFES